MSNTPRNLTRGQLSEFLPNARAVRAFEQLLEQVSTLLPADIATINRLIQETYVEATSGTAKAQEALDLLSANAQTAAVNTGTADAKALAALDMLNSIASSLDVLSKAPAVQPVIYSNDVSPPSRPALISELAGASIKLPAAGNLLIYDATLKVWKNTLLTAGTNLTITNADGSITVNATSGAVEIHAAPSKATPVDADEIPLADSATAFSLKKLTWANLKATLATWIGGNLIAGSFTSLVSSTTGKLATTLGVGNATPAASGAGVTFPATQSSSTDVNTLDDYEEGTWTPVQGSGLTVVGAFSSSGSYTKVGRVVTVNGTVSAATSVAVTAAGVVCTGLPFATSFTGCGSLINGTVTAAGGAVASGSLVLSATTIATTSAIAFTISYTTST